jgi:hypothetical protein
MLLDNLFAHLGAPATAGILFVIVACVGIPAAASIFCPFQRLSR